MRRTLEPQDQISRYSVMPGTDVTNLWMAPADGGLRQLTQGKGETLDDLSRDGGIAVFSKVEDPASVWFLNPAAGG